jgi:hypothetical protein
MMSHLQQSFFEDKTNLFNMPNMLFYGNDFGLLKIYIFQLLQWHCHKPISDIRMCNESITLQNITFEYKCCDHFVLLNCDTQLNKEKNVIIDFTKTLSLQKHIGQSKHIIVLMNIDKLNTASQYRLRRIIERSCMNCVFICACSNYSRVVESLRSRLLCIRTACLSNDQKEAVFRSICKHHDVPDACLTEHIKVIHTKCSYIEDIFFYFLIIKLKDADFLQDTIHLFDFIKNDMCVLLKSYSKTKNVRTIIEDTRATIYKIVHYNIPHQHVANVISDVVKTMKWKNKKIYQHVMHQLSRLLAQFDHDIVQINVCKIIFAYENLLINIFKLLFNTSSKHSQT